MTNVIALPVRGVRRLVADDVDDWGRDHGFVNRLWSVAGLRWDVAVGGLEHLPGRGGLIVVNTRRLALAPVFAALSIGASTQRPVRFVGRPDIAPIGPALQRLGALLALPDELEGALRAGELIVLGAAHTAGNARCGVVDHRLVGAAVAARVPVVPAATTSAPTGRGARVELGPPVRLAHRRRGPLEELELADAARRQIDDLLDSL